MRQIELIASALGTVCKVVVFVDDSAEDSANETINEIRDYLFDMDNKLSVFKDDSEISKINAHQGDTIVSELTFSILKEAIKYYKETDGIFDILVGNNTKQFREGFSKENLKHNESIKNNLIINKKNRSVLLKEEFQIDLGGIAKGFAVNQIKTILKKAHIDHAIINLGGSVLVLGKETKVGIRNPFISINETNQDVPFAEVIVNEHVVITSGIYEQSKNKEMTNHHIIDPNTGKSSNTDIVSATVISKDGVKADVFATALIVLGLEKGFQFVKKKKVDAVFVTRKGEVFTTDGLKNRLFIN